MSKFSCLITGDDYNLLKTDTPESRKKVSALASVIFIPVIIWFANGYLLVSHVLGGSAWSAFVVAVILGSLIFLIEKNIIMAHSSRQIRIFRYSLGIVIALLGAVFLDEVIFKQDVDQQLYIMNQTFEAENQQMVEDSYKAGLTRAQADVDAKHAAWQVALDDAKREADGSGGSGSKGVHAIAKLKLAVAARLESDYNSADAALASLKRKIEAEMVKRSDEVNKSLKDTALLSRIKALFHLVFSDWYMGIIYLLFTAFLFAMEFLVVFLKNAWPLTNYERRLGLIEEIGRRRMEKVLQHDLNHYEPGQAYPGFRMAGNAADQKKSVSLFN